MNRIFTALIAVALLFFSSITSAQPVPNTFQPLAGPELLAPPAGVDLKGLSIAKTPPAIEIHIFPDLPAAPKALWSSWGDGCIAADGKYYTGIGNHLDYDGGKGESRVYVYDPGVKSIKQIVNVRDVVPDERYAGGKIHARIDQGKDGLIYFATYWGKNPEKSSAKTKDAFIGSALLRYDPATSKTELLGPIIEKQGVPTSITDPNRMIWYGYAVYSGDFFAYDLAKRALLYRGGGDDQEGSRNIMLDAKGNAYFGAADGKIMRFDPTTAKVAATKAQLPAATVEAKRKTGSLRASTASGPDGIIFGNTQAGELFSFDPATETVADLGENWPGGQYTAVMALSPDGRYIYYAPGAHGGGSRIGTPIVQYDVKTKQKKVLAFLNASARSSLKYNIGGTYNLKLKADGSQLYITFNGMSIADGPKKLETFGMPSVVIVNIPKEER